MSAYMTEQVIKFSDGSETVIKYNPLGEKIEESIVEVAAEVIAEEPVEVVAEEIVESVEEAESIEESA